MLKFKSLYEDTIKFVRNNFLSILGIFILELILIVGTLYLSNKFLTSNVIGLLNYNILVLITYLNIIVISIEMDFINLYRISLVGKEFSNFKFSWIKFLKVIGISILFVIFNYIIYNFSNVNNIIISLIIYILLIVIGNIQVYFKISIFNEELSLLDALKKSIKIFGKTWIVMIVIFISLIVYIVASIFLLFVAFDLLSSFDLIFITFIILTIIIIEILNLSVYVSYYSGRKYLDSYEDK